MRDIERGSVQWRLNGIKGVVCGQYKNVNEKFWREPAKWDVILLDSELDAFDLKGVLFEGGSIEESPER